VRLYLDESVPVVLATLLHQHGVDCRTVRDAGHLGATDEYQLTVATREGRALFTHDTRDFLRLAKEWNAAGKAHAGILLAHQAPLRELILRFRALLLRDRPTDLSNTVLWLPPVLEPRSE
jgi:predicted nuclease of predicted toxin-antitoxin system